MVSRETLDMRPVQLLEAQAAAWGVTLCREQVALLVRYAEVLGGYDRVRVTGTRAVSEIITAHVIDSLSCLLLPSVVDAESLVDVGSGGGLPGIPVQVAALVPRVTLVESAAKKVRFLEHAVHELRLAGVSVEHARAEEYGVGEAGRERFAVGLTRAVASLAVVAEYCLPLVAVGGIVVAMKAGVKPEEVDTAGRASRLLGGEVAEIRPVSFIPELPQKKRHLVVIEKKAPTPSGYPRAPGRASKRPLGR